MTVITLTKAVARAEVGSAKRSENRAAAIQFVIPTARMFWVTKSYILRNIPITAKYPHPRQAAWRLIFMDEAAKWRGAKGVGVLKYDSRSGKHKAGDRVLKVQEVSQVVLRDAYKTAAATLPPPVTVKPKYSWNSREDLMKYAGKPVTAR